jgi:hypothetical protein
VLARQADHLPAQIEEIFASLLDRPANHGADFDYGLMHLGFDTLSKTPLPFGQHLCRDMRAQVARNRIDGLILLFNSDSE